MTAAAPAPPALGPLRRLFAAHVALVLATLGIVLRGAPDGAAWAGWDTGLGIAASALVFVALYELAHRRRGGDHPLRLAGALWAGELGMRVAVALLPAGQLPIAEARVLRLVLAGFAGVCLAWGLGRAATSGRLRALWIGVRWAFTLQVALIVTLEAIALATDRTVVEVAGRLPAGVLPPLGWTTFALPYAAQLFALHRTLRQGVAPET